jgi:hypothetical protein
MSEMPGAVDVSHKISPPKNQHDLYVNQLSLKKAAAIVFKFA